MYTDKVFLFVLMLYNKILGELVTREEGFCVSCCWVVFTEHNSTSPVLSRRSSGAVTDATRW